LTRIGAAAQFVLMAALPAVNWLLTRIGAVARFVLMAASCSTSCKFRAAPPLSLCLWQHCCKFQGGLLTRIGAQLVLMPALPVNSERLSAPPPISAYGSTSCKFGNGCRRRRPVSAYCSTSCKFGRMLLPRIGAAAQLVLMAALPVNSKRRHGSVFPRIRNTSSDSPVNTRSTCSLQFVALAGLGYDL
jgi:hypothetical protein